MVVYYTFGNAFDDGDPSWPVEDPGLGVSVLDIQIPGKATVRHELIDEEALPSSTGAAETP